MYALVPRLGCVLEDQSLVAHVCDEATLDHQLAQPFARGSCIDHMPVIIGAAKPACVSTSTGRQSSDIQRTYLFTIHVTASLPTKLLFAVRRRSMPARSLSSTPVAESHMAIATSPSSKLVADATLALVKQPSRRSTRLWWVVELCQRSWGCTRCGEKGWW